MSLGNRSWSFGSITGLAVTGLLTCPGVSAAQTFEVLHAFPAPHLKEPYAAPVQASDGNLYGTATHGGINDAGAIFRMDMAGNLTVLHEFLAGAGDGSYPNGGLVQAGDGNLYGATVEGGPGNVGTIYRMTLQGTLTVVRSLTAATDGANPKATLLVGADGNLYGTTSSGGPGGRGTVFKVTTAGTFTVLHSFAGAATDGSTSEAPLIQGADGNLYGTSRLGGVADMGTIFKIALDGTFTLLHSFTGNPDGRCPEAALLQASDGDFYGTTSLGGTSDAGTAFRMSSGGVVSVVHSFLDAADGREPYAALVEVSNGLFWGTTRYEGDGPYYGGRIFAMTSTGTVSHVHDFVMTDGGKPWSSPMRADDGNFYGVTQLGGTAPKNGAGTVYKITSAGTFTSLYSFDAGSDGARPDAPLVLASDGNLYSTTTLGGHSGWGTIFKMTPSGGITILHEFDAANDSQYPASTLVQGEDGVFYGGIQPVQYKITADGTFTRLHLNDTITQGDGTNTLIFGPDGYLYGTTNLFGLANKGTAFKMTTAGAFTLLHTFTGGATDGDAPSPLGKLVQGADGNLYGTTQFGGTSNDGTIFKMTPSGTLTIVHSFNNATEGRLPVAPLILALDGNFYGTTFTGGPNTGGTVFRMTPAGVVTVIHAFSGTVTDGAYPQSAVVQAPNAVFFGTTSRGGSSNMGTVYSLTPEGVFTILHSFTGGAGGDRPSTTPTLVPGGYLYGSTFYGGVDGPGMGIIFRMTVSSSRSFTDDPLVAGSTPIKGIHVTELQTRINALRAVHGLAAYTFSHPIITPGTTPITAQDIIELRNALAAVYVSAGLTPPTYTDPSLGVGTPVRAVHVTELRAAVVALE